MFDRLKTSKAAWTALGGAVTAVSMAWSGQLPWDQALELTWTAFMVVFVRDGIAKGR